jgi:transcriptional regulator with XRE-family HTH domain
MSQLALASAAGISTRHLSFVESGRSQPSRQMLLLLGQTLDLPLRERNTLLRAGGFASAFAETPLDAPALEPARKAVARLLDRLGPYPAVALDRHWNVVLANASVPKLLGFLGIELDASMNVMRLLFTDRVRAMLVNWEEVAAAIVQRLHREALEDEGSRALLEDILRVPGVPSSFQNPDLAGATSAIVTMTFRHLGKTIRLMTAITTLGTPLDVTLEELRIEIYLPGDEETDALLSSL